MTLDGDKGEAIFQSSVNSSKAEVITLRSIAKVIRKHLFSNSTLCNGDISGERHLFSVPLRIFYLLAIILDGKTERDISYFSATYTIQCGERKTSQYRSYYSSFKTK